MISTHWFWGAVWSQRRIYAQVILASVFINLFALVSAFYIMTVYDRVIPSGAMETLLALTIGVMIVVSFDFIMKILRSVFIDRAGLNIDKATADLIFNSISRNEKLGAMFQTGAVTSRIKDFDVLKETFASASLTAFVDLPFVVLFLLVLYAIGGGIVLVPLLVVLAVVLAGLLIQPLVKRQVSRAEVGGHQKQSTLVELIGAMETIKTLRGMDLLRKRWTDSVSVQGDATANSRFWSHLTANIAQTGQQISQIGIVVYGVFLIIDANLTMGSLIACVILSGRTLAPLNQLSSLVGRVSQAAAAYRGMGELLSIQSAEVLTGKNLRFDSLPIDCDFDAITFGYESGTGQLRTLFDGFSLSIPEKQKVAVVGPVGSGKTSLLNLLSGVASPSRGAVKFGQISVSHVHPDDLRSHVGVCHQTPMIFSGTLKENLLLGNPDASDQELLELCETLNLIPFIERLPDGFQTVIGERGRSLSGGQRQLVSIARTMLAKPKVLLLDEPTSALDNQTETQLLTKLKGLIKDMTVVMVTHRSQVLKLCDRVVAIDEGTIKADGDPEELFKAMTSANTERASAR